jgi:hypothetical protein
MESTFEEAKNTPHPSLTEPQRNSLEITLCEMERLVFHSRYVREVAQNADENGVMLQRHAALDESQIAQLKTIEDATMEQLTLLRDALHLRPRREDLQHQLLSAFSILWADLEDERPGRMVGYGKIEQAAINVLEPAIGKLVELCRDFVAVLGG